MAVTKLLADENVFCRMGYIGVQDRFGQVGNLDYLEKYIHDHLPGVRMIRPEGTFLVWLDLGDLGFTPAEQEQRIVGEAGLWLDSGRIFGKSGTGFERINIACPRSILEKAVKRLSFALV